jgi:hypothetical protein
MNQMAVLPLVSRQTFLPDSYGYRPGKSALDAVGVTPLGVGMLTMGWCTAGPSKKQRP